MELTRELLNELQNRLKVGSRRGVHLNAIPANSRYKFDLTRLSQIDEKIPQNFINALLTELPLKFRVSWIDNAPDLNLVKQEDQSQLIKITKSFENLINQTAAIESEKGLNTFGFGFPLFVRRDQVDNKLTVAPVLIWSLRIKRTKEFNTWEIHRSEDDPIYINEVLINHLQNDSGIEISQISNEHLDDGIIDKNELLDVCVKIIESVNGKSNANLRENLEEKLQNINSISDKKHYENLPLTSNNSFIDFCGLFSIFEVQKQNIIQDYNELINLQGTTISLDDMDEHYFQPISSVETDPSQQGILNSLQSSRNILIQGPPGTGKSQSLTAILVNALENNKKTIVVCEKRTALEVLHNALKEKGLDNYSILIKDIVKDRREAVESVRDRVNNSLPNYHKHKQYKETLDEVINSAKSQIETINNSHKKLDEKLLGNKNWTDVVGILLKELKDNTEDFELDIDRANLTFDSSEFKKIVDIIKTAHHLWGSYKPFIQFSFLNPAKLKGDNLFIIEKQIKDDFTLYEYQYKIVNEGIKTYQDEYFRIRLKEIENEQITLSNLSNKFNLIFESIADELKLFEINYEKSRREEYQNELLKAQSLIDVIYPIFQKYSENKIFFNDKQVNSFGFKLKSIFLKRLVLLKDSREIVVNKIIELNDFLLKSYDLPHQKFGENLSENKVLFYSFLEVFEKTKKSIEEKIKMDFLELKLDTILSEEISSQSCFIQIKKFKITRNLDFQNLITRIETQFKLYQSEIIANKKVIDSLNFGINNLPFIELSNSFLKIKKDIEKNFKLINEISRLKEDVVEEELLINDVFKPRHERYQTLTLEGLTNTLKELINKINIDKWSKIILEEENVKLINDKISNIINSKNIFFNNENDLFSIEFKWFNFYNNLSEKEKLIIDELKVRSDWKKVFTIFYLNSLLVNEASIKLPTHNNDYIDLKDSLLNLEQAQLGYIKEFWLSKQLSAIRDFNRVNRKITIEQLYNKRASPSFRRLSLREIVFFDKDLFTTFFPVILTTPDVASNLFKNSNQYFDIVMFDEASQLKLEDNLPALLKGKQIVIAGDEHQMPPSNYFSKIFDGDIVDEDDFEDDLERIENAVSNSLLDCESLLDFAFQLGFEKRYLDFHYRSKHPFLIDFSNCAFYNQRLKPLPNKYDYIPINFVSVNGLYSDNSNAAEAETVLSIIENNIYRLPDGKYPSIGVATFNINQRNLILSKINERRKYDIYKDFNEKILELEENGFFVKNLENIQGDERDVIILSTTYGKNEEGKFAQRFGSINHQKGYKLLNVIITRAKYKIYVCTSIPQDVFLDYKNYLVTEGSNNRRGVFYAYLSYAKSVSEQNNEARNSILQTLSENSSDNRPTMENNNNLESPFEEEVYESLIEIFDRDKIIPQFQYAGFRIDIVYDTKKIGYPKIAIECDGAEFHSSQEAYLHDIHRQKILESNDFVFHRIWSTNWWRNPKKEIEDLKEFIESVENTDPSTIKDSSKMSLSFTDEVTIMK